MERSISVLSHKERISIKVNSSLPIVVFSKQTAFTVLSNLTQEEAFQLGSDLIIASGSLVNVLSPSNDQKSHQ